jgi:hypothetical protein
VETFKNNQYDFNYRGADMKFFSKKQKMLLFFSGVKSLFDFSYRNVSLKKKTKQKCLEI